MILSDYVSQNELHWHQVFFNLIDNTCRLAEPLFYARPQFRGGPVGANRQLSRLKEFSTAREYNPPEAIPEGNLPRHSQTLELDRPPRDVYLRPPRRFWYRAEVVGRPKGLPPELVSIFLVVWRSSPHSGHFTRSFPALRPTNIKGVYISSIPEREHLLFTHLPLTFIQIHSPIPV
jgi:hypothetical protein